MLNVNLLPFKNVKCEALGKFMMISLDAQGIWILIDNLHPPPRTHYFEKGWKIRAIPIFFLTFFLIYFPFIFLLYFEFYFYVSVSLWLSIPKAIGRFVQAPGCHFQCPMRFSLRCPSNNHLQAPDKEPAFPRNAVSPLGACWPEVAASF